MKNACSVILALLAISTAVAQASESHECPIEGGTMGNYYSYYYYNDHPISLYRRLDWRRFISWKQIDRLPQSHVYVDDGYIWQGVKRQGDRLVYGIFLYDAKTSQDTLIKEGYFSQIFINSDEAFIIEEVYRPTEGEENTAYKSILYKINRKDFSFSEIKTFLGEFGTIYDYENITFNVPPDLSRNSNVHFITGKDGWGYYFSYKGDSGYLSCEKSASN